MNILITNNTLADRAGSELYVRDIALALLARGHHPVAFSTMLGPVAEDLRRATVPVIDDLEQLGDPPDLIHGQQHFETAMAALRFPQVPVLSFCHGWLPWQAAPVKLPNVRRYVAVDATCRDRLRLTHGIPTERIELLLNFVDLRRFAVGPELQVRPRRALVFGNAPNEAMLEPIREACRRSSISVDFVGASFGKVHAAPEAILGDYDLIFAKARAALEAMAVGRAVILFDAVGSGPLVRSDDFDRLRALNFGIRSLRAQPTVEHFVGEIAKYDAEDATRVRDRVRNEASLDVVVDRLVAIYESVRGEPITPVAEAIAKQASEYLATIASRVKLMEAAEHAAAVSKQAQAAAAHRNQELKAAHDAVTQSFEQLTTQLAQARAETAIREAARDEALTAASAAREENTLLQARIGELERTLVEIHDSPAMRLRRGVIGAPLVGSLTRWVGQRVL